MNNLHLYIVDNVRLRGKIISDEIHLGHPISYVAFEVCAADIWLLRQKLNHRHNVLIVPRTALKELG